MYFIKRLEDKAEQDEKLTKLTKNKPLEEEFAINDMYLEAVNAKLRML